MKLEGLCGVRIKKQHGSSEVHPRPKCTASWACKMLSWAVIHRTCHIRFTLPALILTVFDLSSPITTVRLSYKFTEVIVILSTALRFPLKNGTVFPCIRDGRHRAVTLYSMYLHIFARHWWNHTLQTDWCDRLPLSLFLELHIKPSFCLYPSSPLHV